MEPTKTVTVADVRNDPIFGPKLQAEVEEIDHQHDLWEARYCAERGLPISKALWKRLRRHRKMKKGRDVCS